MKKVLSILLSLLAIFATSVTASEKVNQSGIDFFEKKIRSILSTHCYKCHSQEAQKAGKLKAELLLDSPAGMRKGGAGGPTVVPGKPSESLLLKAMRYEGALRMPPKKQLPEAVIRDFSTWIAMGAPDPRKGEIAKNQKFEVEKIRKEHWAFQPLRDYGRPAVNKASWARTPIDAFILKKLDEAGVEPAPPANPATLLRRVYFDLIGLPPTQEEQQAFLRDPSPAAYQKVVDDLLQRPQYGERWGRHWLDVVRYAETLGFEMNEQRSFAWRYRDWVIDAFNTDMAYDQFLTEQLAGDEVSGSNGRSQIGATFLRLGPYETNAAGGPNDARYALLDDIVSTTSMAFLGMTMQCARCHDHKFEPIAQADYYRLLAFFELLEITEPGQTFEVGSPEEQAAYRKCVADRQRQFKQRIEKAYQALNQLRLIVAERTRQQLLADKELKVNEKQLDETMIALKTPIAKRSKQQVDGLQLGHVRANVMDEAIKRLGTEAEKAEFQRHINTIYQPMKAPPPPLLASVFKERSLPDTWLFTRGELNLKENLVMPGTPAVLGGEDFPEPKKKRFANTSGRRLWLAQWMTTKAQPLVARVFVNRLWQQHFGRGFVDEANNLGVSGGPPSHSELLNWLANDFVAGGWRIKRMHRQIVLSHTYQQASRHPRKADAEGRLFARWVPRRLEAEAIRDAMLAASGQLNLARGGPSIHPPFKEKLIGLMNVTGGHWQQSDEKESSRRSVYIYATRLVPLPMLDLLGSADASASVAQRSVSATAVQALLLFNGEFSTQQARWLAERLKREAGPDSQSRIRRAFALVLCRAPNAEEMPRLLEFLQRYPHADADKALTALCLVLLNTSEFTFLK